MLYLNDQAIAALLPEPGQAVEILRNALLERAAGRVEMPPRSLLDGIPTSRFIAFPARLNALGVAGVKWYGANTPEEGTAQAVSAQILLTACEGARPLALLDGARITAERTAWMSALAAEHLARPNAASLALLACGAQAHLHLAALARVFQLRDLHLWSRSPATAAAFGAAAEALGLRIFVHDTPAKAVAEADLVVSMSPAQLEQRFSLTDLREGAFVSLVDLGRSIAPLPEGFVLFVDDVEQSRALCDQGRLTVANGADLQAVILAQRPRLGPAIFLPSGFGAADIALGAVVYQQACARQLGQSLQP